IPRGLKPKEETFQVVLDALALTACYPAFIITADVPEIYLRVQGQDFDALPSEEDTISFLRDLGHTGIINSLNDVVSEVALTEEAQMKEVRKKSLRDFHKTHPSGSGTVAEKPPSVDKITPTITSEGTGDKLRVPDVTEDNSTKSESKSWGNDEDDSNNDQDSSNEDSEQENESEEQVSDSEQEDEYDDNQEEEEFVYTPSPIDDKDDDNLESESDDVIKSDEEKEMDDTKEVVQGEGADAKMHDVQQGNENLETTQEQVVEDAHVTIYTVTKKTEAPVTSSSLSSDLESKFLNFSDIPQADAEIVSPLDAHIHHEVPRTEAPILLSVPVSVIPESSPQSRKDKDKDEDPSTGSNRGLKKRKTSKDTEPTTGQKKKDSTSGSSKGTKSQPKSSGKSIQLEEPVFEVADLNMPQDQEGNLGDNEDEPRNETASRRDWFKKPTPPQEPTNRD
ncbi:hypothetical protein Tco_1372225, partial [Tanacetum coccineum]